MAATSLQELFVEELRDIYDGEKRILRALPKMAKAAESDELQTAFNTHLKETERQVSRLEQVFRSIGETPRGKKCDGIMGIVEEGNHAIEELEGPVLDAALIAGAQKVEHYEIATYGTLAYFAELLGHDRAKDLLGETLEEEKATDEKLNELAKSDVNREALMGANGEEMEDEGGMTGMMRRAGSAMGMGDGRASNSRASASRSSGRGNSGGSRAASRRRR
jgi:ferritin-like metal-binding protein YciE